jgi:hypothetical protein
LVELNEVVEIIIACSLGHNKSEPLLKIPRKDLKIGLQEHVLDFLCEVLSGLFVLLRVELHSVGWKR